MAECQSHPMIDPVNSINTRTVQVLAFHPIDRTFTLWVHNLLEPITTYIPRYGNTTKPPGWGHGGGGQEPNEIERLRERDPLHPILANKNISEEDRAIAACGLREFRDESGYQDISIVTIPCSSESGEKAPATVCLYSHRLYDYLEDGAKTTHEIVTLWGEVESLARRPIQEIDEVDKSEWLDISKPLSEIFRDRVSLPGFPYWSHVRRTVIGLQRIDWWRCFFDEPERCISHLVHPSWRLVFPVGVGDPRFPKYGFRISPSQWYYLFEMMVQEQIAVVGANILYELFKEDIERVVEQEHLRDERPEVASLKTPEPTDSTDSDEGYDSPLLDKYSGEPAPEELLRQQDEEYRIWMERELGIA